MLNNMLLKEKMYHWRNQSGNKKLLRDKWQWQHNYPVPIRHDKNSSKRGVYRNTIPSQETRKISNEQAKLIPNESP